MNLLEKLAFLKEAGTGPVTDALTALGIGEWMTNVHPANPSERMAGQAFPIQYEYVVAGQDCFPNMWKVIGVCQKGRIIVASARDPMAVTGSHVILGTKMFGATGFLVDSTVRDYEESEQMDYPVFCRGSEAKHAPKNHKVTAVNVPIVCAGAKVNPGDFIVGDRDGVVVIPEKEIDRVIYQMELVLDVEQRELNAIKTGRSLEEIMSIGAEKSKIRP